MKKLFYIFSSSLLAIFLYSCDSTTDSGANGGRSGKGGSMARFSIGNDFLYIVDNTNLKVVDVSTASRPQYLDKRDQKVGFGIETLFAKDSILFIGSQDGMHIYDITMGGLPQKISEVSHIRSCDPVVSQGDYAYVTLNSQNVWCGEKSNELIVYNVKNLKIPLLVSKISLTNPKGLGVDGKKLFVCDNGIRIYDISRPESPRWIDDLSYIPEANNSEMYDVIPVGGILMAISKDGFYQFDYTKEKVSFISKINVKGE